MWCPQGRRLAVGPPCNAEEQRIGLIQLKQLGPKFTEKQHPGAIYTSRPIKSLISQVSSLNSSSTISNQVSNQVYTSEEYKFDIDNSHDTQRQTISRSSSIKSSSGYISNDLDFDIETNTQRLTTFESIRSSSIKSSSGMYSTIT
ncbi:11509_t:CDS:2 [Rhizophagus irregularis]|nr:11509_t:CDS:2 [Rhizophagus irregularis]